MKKRKVIPKNECPMCRYEPITICWECDREYILLDVRHYRALRDGRFVLKKKIPRLERSPNGSAKVEVQEL